jgi:hypothetical protein
MKKREAATNKPTALDAGGALQDSQSSFTADQSIFNGSTQLP